MPDASAGFLLYGDDVQMAVKKEGRCTMFYQNDYITKNITTQKMNEYIRQAEKDRLLLTLATHQGNPLFYFARSILRIIGHALSASGQQLDRLDAASRDVKIGSVASSK
jgi:hypothetical protein